MALDGGCRIKVQDDVISTEKESFLKSGTWGDLEPLTNNILISLNISLTNLTTVFLSAALFLSRRSDRLGGLLLHTTALLI